MNTNDPFLTLPLCGTQLIEASAGTGKTFTLTTLVTRLIVERRLRIGQILVVTYTDAATQELRKRVRERLALAARLVEAPDDPKDAPDARLSRAIITAHLAADDESPAQLQRRLQQAADEIDLAAIFTIHGFCARVLREHALESGQTFAPPTLLASDRALREALAADLWRRTAADADDATLLMGLWQGGPDDMARNLGPLMREPILWPPATPPQPDPRPARDAAAGELVAAIDAYLAQAQAAITTAFEQKIFDGRRAKRPSFDAAFDTLCHGRVLTHWEFSEKSHLAKLLPERLLYVCKDNTQSQVPRSPLFDALHAWVEAERRVQDWHEQAKIRLLHRLRGEARLDLAQHKQQLRVQTYYDLIEGVADALNGPHAHALVQSLRAQYAMALVDEFQDTDTRQWGIFRTVFGDSEAARASGLEPGLFLIGDPKQAIYGFRGGDVQTYLLAARDARAAPPLDRNFRSRPSVLSAIEALYRQAGDQAFPYTTIRFHRVLPGTHRVDADYQRGGANAPALTLWQAPTPPPDEKGRSKPYSARRSRELAAQACVAAIHQVLSDARAGTATINGTPVQPGDIAVLVRKHSEATHLQQALATVGIPAVAAGQQSLFTTPEAHELLTLLLALLHSADDSRLRAALATVLLGVHAAEIAALDLESTANADWQRKALVWREYCQRGGPLALVSALCASHAERLLGLLDGERRLTNYLQLAELLQQANARSLGLQGLIDWLVQQIAQAETDDETQLLRLESDARRVQIITLHKSKGLEYPLVFLPFVGIGGKPSGPGHACVVADENGQRTLHWKLQPELSGWDAACETWLQAQRAEDARLLYVGLTRAEHALWIACGEFYEFQKTPLWPMLNGLPETAGIVHETTLPSTLPWLPPANEEVPRSARTVTRPIASDWWVYSFTQLANAQSDVKDSSAWSTLTTPGGSDESDAQPTDAVPDAFDPRFAGNRFGVVLHEALEQCDFSAWRAWHEGAAAPGDDSSVIETALKGGGYAADELRDGAAALTSLIGQTLTVTLPEGVRLCDLPADARRAEIEFQFALQPTAIDSLLTLLHSHGVVRHRLGFGPRRTLEGLMTGLIDLTYTYAGRWYVLDYKSNRLPSYDATAMQRAMAHGEYDLQALIYTLALHRWLHFRLRHAYDYARDFGGIRYLFCRGLDATRSDLPGVHAQRFAPALIHALDGLFAGLPAMVAA